MSLVYVFPFDGSTVGTETAVILNKITKLCA